MDDDAFRAFHQQTSSGLWAYLVGACRDRALADDVLQESYLRLLRATHFVPESEEHRRRYLYRIASNLLHDHARSPRRREDSIEDLELAAPPSSSGGDSSGLKTDLARAFANLGARDRQLLWLAHVEGYSHEEIAVTAGVKPKSVRVLLFRARQKLQLILKDAGLAPAGGEA
ncbi:MAG: RNA polymerase sigma factor [Acidobacteriota bacterium]